MAFERVRRGNEALDAVAERDADLVVAQFALEQHRHLGVELRQDLLLQFDELHRQALALQLLGHFQADETGADGDRAHARFGGGNDAVHVLERAQREDACIVDAGDRWADRRRAGREHQLVVAEPFAAAVDEVLRFDALAGTVDAHGFAACAHIEVEQALERSRRLHGEDIARRNLAADVVGQAAVGERDVGAAFEHGDLGRFAKTAGARGAGSTGGDATDDENFHGLGHGVSFLEVRR